MPTIKDIALRAGVSQGTVSNVFNGRGNVSVEKINLVKQAALELGYKADMKAKLLRQGITNNIAVIIPDIKVGAYAEMYSRLQERLIPEGYTINLYLTKDMPAIEKTIINSIADSKVDAVVTVTCLTNPEKYYTAEKLGEAKLIFALRKPGMKAVYVGFDYRKAGQEMAARALKQTVHNVGIFTGPLEQSCEMDFYLGASELLKQNSCRVTSVEAEFAQMKSRAFEFFEQPVSVDCIITSNSLLKEAVENAAYYRDCEGSVTIITVQSETQNYGSKAGGYGVDYLMAGDMISNILSSEKKAEEKNDYIVKSEGFAREFSRAVLQKDETLNILLLNSPTSVALSRIAPLFTKKTGIKLKIMSFSYDEIYSVLSDYGDTGIYDIVRLDMAWLPWFSERILLPLPDTGGVRTSIYQNVVPQLYDDYCYMKGTAYGVPLDPSVQLLFYRKDLFEDVKIRRGYYEKYRRDLKVPDDFKELNQISEYFTRKYTPDSQTEYGMTMVAGNAAFAACEALPRLMAYKDSFFNADHKFDLNNQEMIGAIENYLDLAKYSKDGNTQMWDSATSDFASGKAAMTIVFANYASQVIGSQSTRVAGKIGFAPIPGGKPLLGGGVLSVMKSCKKIGSAMEFLNWVTSDEISYMITMLGGGSANPGVYDNLELLERYPWMPCVKESFRIGVGRKNLISKDKFIDERRMVNILGMAVKNALAGSMEASEALEFASKEIRKLL